MCRAQMMDDRALVRALVETSIVETDGERLQRVWQAFLQQCDQRRRVQPAREIGTYRYIRSQPYGDRVAEQCRELVPQGPLVAAPVLSRRRKLPTPIGAARFSTFLQDQHFARAELIDAAKHGSRCHRRPKRHQLIEAVCIQRCVDIPTGENGLDLGSEDEVVTNAGVIKGQDPSAVSDEHEALAATIPECKRKLTVQLLQEAVTELLVEMHDDLGVRARIKPMPTRLEHPAKLHVIEDLAVVSDPNVLGFVMDRLSATAQIDDAQTSMSETDSLLDMKAGAIRTAVLERRDHAPQYLEIGRRARCMIQACNSTHRSSARVLDRTKTNSRRLKAGWV